MSRVGSKANTSLLVTSPGAAAPAVPPRGSTSPPATYTRPPRTKAVAPVTGSGRWPTTVVLPVARLTCWMTPVGPDGACPPKTQICRPIPVTAG